jgi:hypothetical protein
MPQGNQCLFAEITRMSIAGFIRVIFRILFTAKKLTHSQSSLPDDNLSTLEKGHENVGHPHSGHYCDLCFRH